MRRDLQEEGSDSKVSERAFQLQGLGTAKALRPGNAR